MLPKALHPLPQVNLATSRVLEGIYAATDGDQCVDLDRPGYQHFHAERLGESDVLAISHTFEQNGDLMRDPEIVFWRGDAEHWYPLECTQDPMGGYTLCATLHETGACIETAHVRAMRSVIELANVWAKNLREQFPVIAQMMLGRVG